MLVCSASTYIEYSYYVHILPIRTSWEIRIAMASKRNYLTLAQKYQVVKTAESEIKIGVRKLGQIFGCGKTQISTMLRNKERIKELYEANASGDRCHTMQSKDS